MEKIPVFKIAIPAYQVNFYENVLGPTPHLRWGNPIPRAYEDNKPDFDAVSKHLVEMLRDHFNGERIGLRLLSSDEHEGKSVKELIEIIKELGHDRYDPNRRGDRYENIDNLPIDIFALAFKVGEEKEEASIKYALESFYYYPIINKKPPIRIDLGVVYNLDHLKPVAHRYEISSTLCLSVST